MQCTCTCNVYALRNASSGWSWLCGNSVSVFGDYSEEEEGEEEEEEAGVREVV